MSERDGDNLDQMSCMSAEDLLAHLIEYGRVRIGNNRYLGRRSNHACTHFVRAQVVIELQLNQPD